jgi:hypothetical protein
MEPYDLWECYLEGPHKANPPHFFAAHRRPEEEIKVVGMEVARVGDSTIRRERHSSRC